MFFKSKKETPVDPFELDWGEITPDGYNQNEKSSLCVFAHSLISEEDRPLSSIFAAEESFGTTTIYPKEQRTKYCSILEVKTR